MLGKEGVDSHRMATALAGLPGAENRCRCHCHVQLAKVKHSHLKQRIRLVDA
jgi:hypothetical protein